MKSPSNKVFVNCFLKGDNGSGDILANLNFLKQTVALKAIKKIPNTTEVLQLINQSSFNIL